MMDDSSRQLDPSKSGQIFLSLLTTSIAESRALQKIIIQHLSEGNANAYHDLMQQVRKLAIEEYETLKEQTFANYGKLPPGLFDNEKGNE